MALYDVEILKSPRSPKALKLICTLAGIGEREIKQRLRNLPVIVKGSIPLSEAVAIERQLKRLGVRTHLVKMEIGMEDSGEEPFDLDSARAGVEEIIEIPEDEVKVLHPYSPAKRMAQFKRKKMGLGRGWMSWLILLSLVAAVILVSWYVIALTNKRHTEMEINLYIDQWRITLQQQDLMLDGEFPPERIFYKLDEIEGKIERSLALVKSAETTASLRSKFEQAKWESQSLVRDLAFRKSLEDAGYPIHPTCMVDGGMVRGFSEMPESSLLRIQLMGQNNIESVYFAARISGGTFKLIIDPSIEQNIYDARATVASLSQQPKGIQRWAERRFSLSDICQAYLPQGRQSAAMADKFTVTNRQPQAPKESRDARSPSRKAGVSLADPGSDEARARELEENMGEWTETILSYQQRDLADETQAQDQIHRRLLDLEVRIDQLIGLLESNVVRNVWVERREDIYGSFIDIRQEIEEAHEDYLKVKNPFSLESAIRRNLKERGFHQAEVLVIDSPKTPGAFVIETEITQGKREEVLVALAQVLRDEMHGSSLKFDRISLHYAGRTMWWTPDQIRKAIEALHYPDGPRRCASLLEISSSNISPP